MLETQVILKSLLLQFKLADTVEDAVAMVENLCEKEWITEANKIAKQIKDRRKK